jgi:hypothetical protein
LRRISAAAASSKQLYAKEENQKVIQEADHGNKARDKLDGTKQVGYRADCNQPRVPTNAGMLEREVKNLGFPVKALYLHPPVHKRDRFMLRSGAMN